MAENPLHNAFALNWDESREALLLDAPHLSVRLRFVRSASTNVSRVVLITDGVGSAREEPLERMLLETLQHPQCAIGTLTFLQKEESGTSRRHDGEHRTSVLAEAAGCIIELVRFLSADPKYVAARVCLVAFRDGAALALLAAAERRCSLSAIAILEGRPIDALTAATHNITPTLFVVADGDELAGGTVRAAYTAARGPRQLALVLPRLH